jgi:N-acetylglutamate synthase-like GNAT family acetyltransferase
MSAGSDFPNVDHVHVRPGETCDAPSLRELARDSYSQYVDAEGSEPEPMKTDYLAAIERGHTWVAQLRDEIVGLLILEPYPDYLLLDNIAVANRLRGHGIGRLLMDFSEQRASELGLPEIRLYTGAVMTQNRHYYAHRGFTETRRAFERGHHRVYYSKSLQR